MNYEVVKRIVNSAAFLKARIPFIPETFFIMGTGLGGFGEKMDVTWEIDYKNIPDFPIATSPEHKGRLLVGIIGNTRVAVFQGRFHYYEGYSTAELTMPVRIMSILGSKNMVVCSASGGLENTFSPGDMMLVTDHINFIPDNPLRGKNIDKWGIRFPDMSEAYSKRLIEKAKICAKNLNIDIKEGTFVAVPGPSLETPGETRFLRLIGAKAVAMSMVPEVITGVHAGLNILGIAIIANVNDPDNFKPISIEDVIQGAKMGDEKLSRLLITMCEDEAEDIWNRQII